MGQVKGSVKGGGGGGGGGGARGGGGGGGGGGVGLRGEKTPARKHCENEKQPLIRRA